ncbi:hypothetical protein HK096_002687 [Nowakowskiella sp. JEL0078]|nr:hypothetical protein HK096_002687 [Nowakowskiella sp. JEL0078]
MTHLEPMGGSKSVLNGIYTSHGGRVTHYKYLNEAVIEKMKNRVLLRYKIGLPSVTFGKGRDVETVLGGTYKCLHGKKKKKTTGWSSGHICTQIRVDGNDFEVLVWNQRCLKCHTVRSAEIDEERYISQICSKLELMFGLRESIRNVNEKKDTPPHITELCEGCMAGICYKGVYV